MKKLAGISLFIFWTVVTAILVVGLLLYQKKPDTNPVPVALLPSGAGQMVLDSQEIAKHNSESDCWMIIDAKVYNLTSYLGMHPGGAAPILPYCGKDGSQAFATKDQKSFKPHSDYANTLLANYYIGDLNQKIDQAQIVSRNQPPTPGGSITDPVSTPVPVPVSTPSTPPPSLNTDLTLNAQEIAKRNSTKDCWLVISNRVYNVTNYLGAHPGGVGAIAPYCGKDATQAFVGLPHSSYAASLLSGYYIGNLNQTASAQQIQRNIQNTNTLPPATNRGVRDRGEYDD